MEIHDNEILNIAKSAIRDKIIDRFTTTWSSPINKMADDVVAAHSEEIKVLMEDCLNQITSSKLFKETVQEEFIRKVAKTMVGKLEGIVAKSVDKLNNDPTLRARMILALETIIKETN